MHLFQPGSNPYVILPYFISIDTLKIVSTFYMLKKLFFPQLFILEFPNIQELKEQYKEHLYVLTQIDQLLISCYIRFLSQLLCVLVCAHTHIHTHSLSLSLSTLFFWLNHLRVSWCSYQHAFAKNKDILLNFTPFCMDIS